MQQVSILEWGSVERGGGEESLRNLHSSLARDNPIKNISLALVFKIESVLRCRTERLREIVKYTRKV